MTNNANSLTNVILKCKLTANSRNTALEIAYQLLDEVFSYDSFKSERAGYPIYTCNSGSYVCDLEDRIEINFANGLTKNIWFMEYE